MRTGKQLSVGVSTNKKEYLTPLLAVKTRPCTASVLIYILYFGVVQKKPLHQNISTP